MYPSSTPETGIQALKNVSFTAEPGHMIAIIGRTGSGKSTIANLIMRMYDCIGGEISIDGAPLQQLNLDNYRSQVGFVPQEVFLFADTIANNIAVQRRRYWICSKLNRPPKTRRCTIEYHGTGKKDLLRWIGERGVTLSGGQTAKGIHCTCSLSNNRRF